MPRIFDNIDQSLLPALRETMEVSDRADFCVGYFNLRGWKSIDEHVEKWSGGEGHCCRLLVGMQRLPQDHLLDALSVTRDDDAIDNRSAIHLKRQLATEFRDQLTIGVPTDADERGLRRLARQLRAGKVVVKLYLRHPLHAKLYLLFRPDPVSPRVGYLGSSNLTFAGLSRQGELNVDVVDQDACGKLATWFEDRWTDRWCVDISQELIEIIDESWARETAVPPYHIYLKMAYHLSREARKGVDGFRLPKVFDELLFDFQKSAVQIAARHLTQRGGVLIGDVVGLGKTLMATALARIFEDDHGIETLILCPKNLKPMWEHYRAQYGLRGRVISTSRCEKELAKIRRYKLVLIDESHNLRNREGKRYRAIQDYIQANESKVILLSATPYNKTYIDLSNQLRLFLEEDRDVGVRPENLLREVTETEFLRRHQCSLRSLAAFEKSEHADDWRELMRLFMVRRTRSFIQANYSELDETNGRRYLTFADGRRSYFPTRVPRTVPFSIDDADETDQYAALFSTPVVDAINRLQLPRYGLANYIDEDPHAPPTRAEGRVMADLSRAGNRLRGFCRTNLFKRLESCGPAFIQSVERHILRNYVYFHALEQGEPIPIGPQDSSLLDVRFSDADATGLFDPEDDDAASDDDTPNALATEADYRRRAEEIYTTYRDTMRQRFRWLAAGHFRAQLATDLEADAHSLMAILDRCGAWDADRDAKLGRLLELVTETHADEKLIVFTQFADTVRFLANEFAARDVDAVAPVTGDTGNPTKVAWRFSPVSNEKRGEITPADEHRVLIATDVLSEGQNLQDAAIVVNFDLPWAIIRLFQRAGRVDRIGQTADEILCYTFLPADGVERVIKLRSRIRQRLKENREVVGTDESFFEDDDGPDAIQDLFTEKSGILDGDDDSEVDLGSQAFQIWKNAIEADPSLEKTVPDLPGVVYSSKSHDPSPAKPRGVLAFVRTAEEHDALVWLDEHGRTVTESQIAILRAAECPPDTPAVPRLPNHHGLVEQAVKIVAEEERSVGGQLGSPAGARFRTYERLKNFLAEIKGTLLDTQALRRAFEDIHTRPLRPLAVDILNRLLRSGTPDEDLAARVCELRDEGRLCVPADERDKLEPRVICSLGLAGETEGHS